MMSATVSVRNMCKPFFHIRWFPFVLSLFLLCGCTKPRFTLEFSLPAALHIAYTIDYYNATPRGGQWIETGVMVQQGKAKASLPLADESIVGISAAGNVVYLYVKRGQKITISGESAELYSWKIGGNDINRQWSEWRIENKEALNGSDSKRLNSAVEKYVKKNPDNPLSALLLLYEYNRRENNPEFLKLWKSLKGEAAMEKWITLSGRSDLYTGTPVKTLDTSRSHTFVLKSLGNGADTIVTGKVPVVLLFWRNTDKDRGVMIDSLRSLRKAHPDSASFIIADICFEPDSINWATPLRRDSLKETIRAWIPFAEADSLVKALGVEHTPYILTIDTLPKAKQKKTVKKKATAKKNS